MDPNQPPPYPPNFPYGGTPPVPRDADKASLTEMMPFGSRKIRMSRSPLTILLLICAVAAPLLFTLFLNSANAFDANDPRTVLRNFERLALVAVFVMTITYCFIVYFYCKPGRSVWLYLIAYIFVTVAFILPQVLGVPFLWEVCTFLFRTAVGFTYEGITAPNQGFFEQFGRMFIAAGLCEELFKALPILFGAALALAYGRKPGGPRSGFVRFFQIRGPLDGALMGVFTGAAFVFFETSLQYVPDMANNIFEGTGEAGTGVGFGLMLLFPRVIGGIVGHSAYSAIFGYFIGLGVLRRKQFIPLVLAGWLLAALIHGLWNSVTVITPYLTYAVAIVAAIFAGAALLKARQLNQAMYGEAPETLGSIIVDRSGAAGGAGAGYASPYGGYPPPPSQPFPGYNAPPPQPYGGYPPPPQTQGGYPPAQPPGGYPPPSPHSGYPPAPASFTGYDQPPAYGSAGFGAPPVAPPEPASPYTQPAPPPPPPPVSEQALNIDIDGIVIPVRAGATIDLSAEPALAGRGDGARGEVVPHPNRVGVLGLKNSGASAWTAYLRDGRTQQIARDQNVRLAAGVRIDFGGGLIGNVVARD